MKTSELASRVLRTTFLTGVAASAVTPAFAQDEEAASEDRIVVTGSRIAREDLAAPSPLTQVDAAALNVVNTVNAEDFLNDLPQIIPAFDSTSNNPGNGTATLNLRGLGVNRTLVLVDGKRMVTQGRALAGTVDINNIPAALIDRIDVVTGGASAVYGSDAVAGVVNFILKDDFEGAELSATYQSTGKGDAQTLNLSALVGGNFAEGRGNAVMALGYTNRKPLLQGDRDFSSLTLQEDFNPATGFLFGGSSNSEGGRYLTNAFGTFGAPANCAVAGTACLGNTFDPVTGEFRGFETANASGQLDFYNYAPTNYLQLPQERYNLAAFATYEVMDGIELYTRGMFTNTVVDQQLAPTPVALTGGTSGSTYMTVQEDNPFLFGGGADPQAAAFGALLAACATCNIGDTNGDMLDEYQFILLRRYSEIGTRNFLSDTNTYLFGGGIRGDFDDNWQWDVYAQFARSANVATQTGGIAFGAATNPALNVVGSCSTFSAASCPSNMLRGAVFLGLANVFGPANMGTLQPDQVSNITRTAITTAISETTQILATIGGETSAQSPWASRPIGLAGGLEYREEFSAQIPDSVAGPDIAGPNQTVPVSGRYDVYEAFFEVDIPLVSDVDFVQDFSINGGYRYSDYSSVGGVSSFFVGGTWQIVDDIRLRSQFQRAVRAPNISELFLAPGNGFPGVGDPCAGTVAGTFGLYRGLSAAQQATVSARCIADGVPAARVGANLQTNGQVLLTFAGNGATLEAEKADTLTIGAVITPTVLDGFTATVDYYDISIGNVIAAPTSQSIMDDCFLFNIASACAFTNRAPNGNIVSVGTVANPVLVANQTVLTQKGIDLNMSYRFDLPGDWGAFAWNFNGTYTLEAGVQGDPSSTFFDCVGLYGGVCGEPTPEIKFSTLGTWTWGPLATSFRFNWLSGVDDAATVRYEAYAGNRLVASVGSYHTLDLTLQYDLNETIAFTFGANNVLDADVPIIGTCCNEQANTYPGTYETLGRQFFAGATLRF